MVPGYSMEARGLCKYGKDCHYSHAPKDIAAEKKRIEANEKAKDGGNSQNKSAAASTPSGPKQESSKPGPKSGLKAKHGKAAASVAALVGASQVAPSDGSVVVSSSVVPDITESPTAHVCLSLIHI